MSVRRRGVELGVGIVSRIAACLAALPLSSERAAAVDTVEVGKTCAAVLQGSASVSAVEVIDACTFIIEHPADQASKARALRYRGLTYERQKDFRSALADLDGALELSPDDDWALQARARVHLALGNQEKAKGDFARLLELHPNETRWRQVLSQLGAAPPAPAQEAARLAAPDPAPAATEEPASPTAQDPDPTSPQIRQTELPPDAGSLIRELQAVLLALGYDPGPVSGRLGGQTREAMDRFAAAAGLQPAREPDQGLLRAAKEELRHRQEQADARQKGLNQRAQLALLDLGYDLGVADGIFGQRSRAAFAEWLGAQGRAPRESVDEAMTAQLEAAVAAAAAPMPDQRVAQALPPSQVPATGPKAMPTANAPPEPTVPPEPVTVAPVPPAAVAAVPARHEAARSEPEPIPPSAPTRRMPGAAAPAQDTRVALVIGNSAYRHVDPLLNPRRDAQDIAAALRDIGFEVIDGFDLDRGTLDQRTKEFAQKAAAADLALAYYSGHGLQYDGKNYLVPVDAQVETRYDLRSLVELDQLIDDASQAKRLAMVVVDACRNNPFTELTRSLGASRSASALGPGLARPEAVPPQTLIAYATANNTVAYDGDGENSPYVDALLRHLKTPELEVRLLFGKVRDDVARATANRQQPDYYASLGGEEMFLVRSAPTPSGIALAELTAGERRAVQRSLKWLGWWEGPVDGELSDWLLETVRNYQRDHGEPDTGLLSPGDLVALHRQAALRRPRESLPPISLLSLARRIQAGEPEALRQAGMVADPLYEALPGEPKDPDEAAGFYRSAAEMGDTMAVARLGILLSGPGRPAKDQAEGREWLERAAARGDAAAALRLAELLLTGPVAGPGRERAVALLRTAAADPETDGLAAARLRDLGE